MHRIYYPCHNDPITQIKNSINNYKVWQNNPKFKEQFRHIDITTENN